MKRLKSLAGFLVLVGLVLCIGSGESRAWAQGKSNPGVLPPHSKPYGMSYGKWSAAFWQWAFSLPADGHPLFSDDADCTLGQTGHVWFLGETFAAIEIAPGVILGEANRECVIPSGTALFFPLVNVECSQLEGNGETEEELRACANFFADFIVPEMLSCTVDGKPVKNLPSFRVESPLFTYGPLPDGNILQAFGLDAPEGSTSPAVGDGVHVMLAPLPVGEHEIKYGGVIDLSPIGGPMFIQDITYKVTVVPHK
jgi:hypothetical protein